VRWMSPEVLQCLGHSKLSDVFSFGILLFEIFGREEPWRGFANMTVATNTVKGLRMRPPANAPPVVVELMVACGAHEPRMRPTMRDVQRRLRAVLDSIERS